jgi:hypothetical protein
MNIEKAVRTAPMCLYVCTPDLTKYFEEVEEGKKETGKETVISFSIGSSNTIRLFKGPFLFLSPEKKKILARRLP